MSKRKGRCVCSAWRRNHNIWNNIRILFLPCVCQILSHPQSRSIDAYIVQCGIWAGEIHIFKNTGIKRFFNQTLAEHFPIFVHINQFARKDRSFRFKPHGIKHGIFRCKNIIFAAVPIGSFTFYQWTNSLWIAKNHQPFSNDKTGNGISALHSFKNFGNRIT